MLEKVLVPGGFLDVGGGGLLHYLLPISGSWRVCKTSRSHFLFLPLFQSTVLQPFWTNLNIFGNILFRGGSKLVPEQLWFLRQNVANLSQTGDCGLDCRGIHLCEQGTWAFQHFLSRQCVWKTCLPPKTAWQGSKQRRKLTHTDKVGGKGNSCFRKLIAATSQDILLKRFLFFGGRGGVLVAKGPFVCNSLQDKNQSSRF